ncbi:MAG: uridine phosphorylase [Thermotoga sp.]|nr:MAG: uridine phosphorylase [Thermotoga sp.]
MEHHILCKKNDIGKVVLLPGDPGRCKFIMDLMDESHLVSSNREFTTYTGKKDGVTVSCTSTGIGCPSASIAAEELINIGAKYLIRVGTCGSLQKDIGIGELIIVSGAVRGDGTSKEYVPIEYPAVASFEVVKALVEAAEAFNIKFHLGIVRTHDAFYIESPFAHGNYKERIKVWTDSNVLAVENESAAIFIVSSLRKVKAGALLVPAGNLITGIEASKEDVHTSIVNMIRVALKASKFLIKGR